MERERTDRERGPSQSRTLMVTSERSTGWNARNNMSYDIVKGGNVYRYDTGAPHTLENWYSTYGQTLLCDAGVQYAVEHGKPTRQDVLDLAADRILAHGAPDDVHLFFERIQHEMMDAYDRDNSKAYGILLKSIKLTTSRSQTMIKKVFGPKRDASGFLKWLRDEASPETPRRQMELTLETNALELLPALHELLVHLLALADELGNGANAYGD